MPLVTMRCILQPSLKAFKGLVPGVKPFAIGAYNVNNLEQIQALVGAAQKSQAPLILQLSRGALKHAEHPSYLKHLCLAASEVAPELPIAVHLDHGDTLETVKKFIELGCTSVMIDGSLMPDGKTVSDYEYNVRVTKSVVEYAKPRGITVEGEIGVLGGLEEGHGTEGKGRVTDPAQAEDFVAKTGVDALAIAIGTSHGAYKFSAAGKIELRFDVLEEIRSRLPETFLVLHGASSVPDYLAKRYQEAGGKFAKPALGVPFDVLKKAIELGINKVNVDTDYRLAFMAGFLESFNSTPTVFDFRPHLAKARQAIFDVAVERNIILGSAGKMSLVVPSFPSKNVVTQINRRSTTDTDFGNGF